MNPDIADTVERKKREEEKLAFLRQWVLNAVLAGCLKDGAFWHGVVIEGRNAWESIEAERGKLPPPPTSEPAT